MRRLSIVMPYYMNPGMLAHQYATWTAYPAELKERVDIVIVDDGSPVSPAADVPRPEGLPALSIFRVLEDRPWHQHGARNLGAFVAKGPWLLLTDMDHVLPAESLDRLLECKNSQRVYTFARVDAPNMTPTVREDGTLKPHPNSFAMAKALYWEVGGYDEDYCGVYGTDGLFRSRLFKVGEERHLVDVVLVRYPRDVIADASTTTLPRKEGRDPQAKALVAHRKREEDRADKITTLNFKWERAI